MLKLTKILLLFIFISNLNAYYRLTQCKGCHGSFFERRALRQSKIVNEMTRDDIEEALKRFKESSTPSPIMYGQTQNLTDYDISNIADSISYAKMNYREYKENCNNLCIWTTRSPIVIAGSVIGLFDSELASMVTVGGVILTVPLCMSICNTYDL